MPTLLPSSVPPLSMPRARRRAATVAAPPPQRDAAFVALLDAYRSTGGLMRGDELASLQSLRQGGDHVGLARAMVSGEVLCFDWNDTIWVPAFQLDRDSLALDAGARRVLAELSRAFDGWSAAHWFIAPNAWLRDRAPLDRMARHLDAVVDAARADCFIANG